MGMDFESFRILEEKIEQVLGAHGRISEDRDRLRRELEQARAKVAELEEQLQRQEEERSEIKARVERILGRLDGIEVR